jgi:tetratricopeptide (TPR) repeat protein
MLTAPLLALLGVTGCAQLNSLKARMGRHADAPAMVEPAPPAGPAVIDADDDTSLAVIVNDQLQRGRYAEGEKALRRFLVRHPGDRAARAVLRQLTADPKEMLGRPGRTHVVQAGESYSTLAARYLGDPGLFLILARYNGSTNPSMLRVGQTLHLPRSAAGEFALSTSAASAGGEAAEGGAPMVSAEDTATSDDPPAAKATRLQEEGLALLDQGHREQALARLDEALAVDPQLQPAKTRAASLRKQLVATYHQRAIVLYRDQQLDQAIALWDRVLALDPGYEPAVIYRTRARELKRRLKQF